MLKPEEELRRNLRNNLFFAEALFLLLIILCFFLNRVLFEGFLIFALIVSVAALNISAGHAADERIKHASELNLTTRQLQQLHSLIHSLLLTQKRDHLLEGMLEYLKNVIPNSACAVYFCKAAPGAAMKIERLAWYEEESIPVPDSDLVYKAAGSMTPLMEYASAELETRRVSPLVFQSRIIGVVDISKPRGMTSQELKMYQLLIDYVSGLWMLYDLIAAMEEEASIDSLTGIWNRRYLLRRFQEESDRIARYKGSVCVVMADIGNFKQVNDRYGHGKGDEVLVKTAGALKRCLRVSDSVGRYGGDEFLVLMPNISKADAETVIERIKAELKLLRINSTDNTTVDVVLDFGIAVFPGDALTLTETINIADENMFVNKIARKRRLGLSITREGAGQEGVMQ